MRRLSSRAAMLLGAALATSGCSSLGTTAATKPSAAPVVTGSADATDGTAAANSPYGALINKQPVTLDGEIRRAQLLRVQGNYRAAIHILSQLMLVAADDPRVVGEYGKVLAQEGRSADAIAFLSRAVELQHDNWTFYSALGVAYDQEGDRDKAEAAYKHALALKPDNPSVLNNYAMSQMMAGHLNRAETLLHQAAAHGGDSPKIANNLKMIAAMRAKRGLPASGPESALRPRKALASARRPVAAPVRPVEVADETGAPHALVHPKAHLAKTHPAKIQHVAVKQAKGKKARPRVVMQRLPYDPLAGKVYGHHRDHHAAARPHLATKTARPKLAKTEHKPQAKPETKQAALTPAKSKAPVLRTAADLY